MISLRYAFACLVSLAATGPVAQGAEQQEAFQPVHWAFSSVLGTGWYKIDESRSVFVLRIPPRYTIREPRYGGPGDREIGIELHFPVTLGLHNIDDLPGIIESDNFGTIMFTPGVELEIPVTESFALRPFANFGWGNEFNSEYAAWSYYGGVKARYRFFPGDTVFSILGGVSYAGYTPNEGNSDHLTAAMIGFEGGIPLSQLGWDVTNLELDWHANYSYFVDDLEFPVAGQSSTRIEDMFEIGLAISPRDYRFRFWWWEPEQIGLGYKFSSDGTFSAITLNFRSWFTR